MITMLLGGLWHGAAWTFVLWGALPRRRRSCVEHALDARRGRMPAWLRWFVTFHLVVLGWILFRAPDLEIAGDVLRAALRPPARRRCGRSPVVLAVVRRDRPAAVPERSIEHFRLRIEALHPVALGVGLAVVILVVGATVPSQGVPPFIYFQF